MSTVALKVVPTKRPLSKAVIGYRIVLAHINLSGWDVQSGEYCQSFAPCHRLCESGDYQEVTPEILEKNVARKRERNKMKRIIPH